MRRICGFTAEEGIKKNITLPRCSFSMSVAASECQLKKISPFILIFGRSENQMST